MPMICDDEGNELGELMLSDKQRELLAAGGEVTISYHTPQLMLGLLGKRSGRVTIRPQGKQVIACNAGAFREFMMLRAAIDQSLDVAEAGRNAAQQRESE